MRRRWSWCLTVPVVVAAAPRLARADDPEEPDPGPSSPGETIEVTDKAPTPPGTISLDAQVARQTAGAMGEPFRALSLLPGVTTSIAASGYPIIRGTLPGESRYSYDGIEIPMLYHLLIGNQVIHPSFIGDLELRAGGAGAEQGNLIGGLITMTAPPIDGTRTELRGNPVEVGAYRAQRLSSAATIAAAVRFGTLAIAAKIYDPKASMYYVDQQARLVYRLGPRDVLTFTSIGAYDNVVQPPDSTSTKTDRLGFHRLDARWTHSAEGHRVRAGIETSLDTMTEISDGKIIDPGNGMPPFDFGDDREGGKSYGVRGYVDGSLELAPWLTARAGLEARHRTLVNGRFPFHLTPSIDPMLGPADSVDAEAAWLALDLVAGPLRVTPGVRVDRYDAELYGSSAHHVSVDPRLAIVAALPGGARAELAGGLYSAPPQVSIFDSHFAIGPLPMTDGYASAAGTVRARQVELSLHTPLGSGFVGSFATYYRDTHYPIDFAMAQVPFWSGSPCDSTGSLEYVYRNLDTRAIGFEAMIRRDLGRSVTGWLSYSLTKIDRDFGFMQLPGDYDQRHTLNATAQWRRGRWTLGATGHLHTGRPAPYPELGVCSTGFGTLVSADHLRRLPTDYRLDLRAERSYTFDGWNMRLFFELQNATFTPEPINYEVQSDNYADPKAYHVGVYSLLIPLPLLGIEVTL
jgi:hypothetical protein